MTGVASKVTPLLVLVLCLIVFLYVTQPAAPPLPMVYPDHNVDPTVIGPLLLP
ncbi:MAG: hypothetical protein KJO84_07390 [Acidimicrobiia bacterium]|nr:hypothetical protein [Acidimicrobiia bacterium]